MSTRPAAKLMLHIAAQPLDTYLHSSAFYTLCNPPPFPLSKSHGWIAMMRDNQTLMHVSTRDSYIPYHNIT